ncbi:hypothetical protein [Streptomyces drozdowiczii]|uniref:hypothetical protein n=1 Tax=Streptomyces drozdowiczii TaxID=202862 RepID=UPI00403C5888
MNARRVSAAAGVVFAAQKTRQTATGIAAALEAACLLQSPESAAEQLAQVRELDGLRVRVAELEATLARLGARAEQRHLMDPLDEQLSHLADEPGPRPDCPLGGLHSPGVACGDRCHEHATSLAKLRRLLARQSGGAK